MIQNSRPTFRETALVRYVAAILAVAISVLITLNIDLISRKEPFALFFAAVMFATWFGGRFPGLAALVLSAFAVNYFILSPVNAFVPNSGDAFQIAAFAAVALLINWLTANIQHRETVIGESEAHYRHLFENNPFPMWIFDRDTLEFLAVNDAATFHYGYSHKEFLSMTIKDIRPESEIPALVEEVGRIDRAIEPIAIWKHRKKDGSVIDAEIISHPITYEGRPARMILSVDVTERERAMAAVRANENLLVKVFSNCPVAVLVHRWSDRTMVDANAGFTTLSGWERDEVVGRTTVEVGLIDIQKAKHLGSRIEEEGFLTDVEVAITTRSGETRHVIMGAVFIAMRGEAHVITTFVDITARNQAEKARRTSDERYRTLFEYAPDGILIADPGGSAIDANETMYRMLGYSHEKFIGLSVAEIVAPEEIEQIDNALAIIRSSAEYNRSLRFRRKDGSMFTAEVRAIQMADGNILAVIRDITDRKQLEEQLRQSQKMEAIGLLAGGIAHDFNNLLTVIIGYSELTLMGISKDDPIRQNIVEIKESGGRAAELTNQLLAFSRKQVLIPTVHNPNSVISNIEKMLRRIIKENIVVRIVLDPELGNIKADPGQIEQVILNLAVNARDAMPRGGRLTIETQNVVLDKDYVSHHIAITPGPFVKMIVTDTGEGMDEATQQRIFEPFFTTKDLGKGTGLGLSTVYGIVKQSGGDIMVYSEVGHGTTFKVYIPRVEEDAENTTTLTDSQDSSGSETILVVEDEDIVRTLVIEILTGNGYRVLEAANGAAALSICETYTEPIDLLLTDVIMPNMSGPELMVRLAELRQNTPTLFMSGYTDDAITTSGVLESETAFIEKPFTPDSLLRKVREVLKVGVTGQNRKR